MQAVLDHVADRHDADQLVLLDHRDVPELAERHPLHDPPDGLGQSAGHHLAGHHLRQRLVERVRAALRQSPHDVALGQDADDAAIRPQHQQCTDPALRQRPDGARKACGGFDRDHIAALGGKNAFHGHGSPPLTGSAPTRGAPAVSTNDRSCYVFRRLRCGTLPHCHRGAGDELFVRRRALVRRNSTAA